MIEHQNRPDKKPPIPLKILQNVIGKAGDIVVGLYFGDGASDTKYISDMELQSGRGDVKPDGRRPDHKNI